MSKSKIINELRIIVKDKNWPKTEAILLIGFSGGADSLALLNSLYELKFEENNPYLAEQEIIACHFDHQWSEASKEYLNFCREFCQKLDIEVYFSDPQKLYQLQNESERASLPPNAEGESKARQYRQSYFKYLIKKLEVERKKKVYLLLAHQLEDKAETVLMNIFRGSSLAGLVSMPAYKENVIRPLIGISKQEIYEYLKDRNLDYIEDATNFLNITARNQLRNQIIPLVEENFPEVSRHIVQLSNRLLSLNNRLEDSAKKHLANENCIYEFETEELRAFIIYKDYIAEVESEERMYFWRLLIYKIWTQDLQLTETHLSLLDNCSKSKNGSTSFPFIKGSTVFQDNYSIRIWINMPKTLTGLYTYKHLTRDKQLKKLSIGTNNLLLDSKVFENLSSIFYNYSEFLSGSLSDECRLVWRYRREADYIELVDGHKKSLKKFMSEQAIPQELRSKLPCLAKGSEILFVPNIFIKKTKSV